MANDISAMVKDLMLAQMLREKDSGKPVEWSLREKQILYYALVFWFICFEGVWFYMNLAGPIQNLARHGKFVNAAEQFQYILRDETQHIRFGVQLINEFQAENPEILTTNFIHALEAMIHKAVLLEDKYIAYCIPNGCLGYSISAHTETSRFYTNLRMKAIGMVPIYEQVSHQFPWMSETLLTNKEKNFFETRVTEYQTGGALEWD